MNTPARSLPSRSAFVMSGLALVTAVVLVLPSYALAPDPNVPSVSILDVKKNTEKLQLPDPSATSGSGRNQGNNQGGKGGKGGQQAAKPLSSISTKSDLTYVITLRNNSKIPAKNVAVEYHFYNRTSNTTNGLSTYSIEDVTSTENLDVDPGSNKELVTQPISHEDSMSVAGGANSGGGGGGKGRSKSMSTPITTMTNTSVMGWHVEVRYNDKIIAHRDYPDNLQSLLKNYQQ